MSGPNDRWIKLDMARGSSEHSSPSPRLGGSRRLRRSILAARGYPMRIFFGSGRGYLPDQVDGAIMSIHALFRQLRARGHDCEAYAGIETRNRARIAVYRLRRLLTGRRTLGWADRGNGYPTYRLWRILIPALIQQRIGERRPDLVLTQLELCERIAGAATGLGVPAVLYVHDAEFEWLERTALDSNLLLLLSASRFIATRVRERLGRETPVLYPIVEPERDRGARRGGAHSTLVNPVPKKGVDVAVEVARLLPHRRFLFVETWPLSPPARRALGGRPPPPPQRHAPPAHVRHAIGVRRHRPPAGAVTVGGGVRESDSGGAAQRHTRGRAPPRGHS